MEMIVNPLLFDSDLKFSDTEKLDVQAVKEAVEKTNALLEEMAQRLEGLPIHLFDIIEKSAIGGSVVTKTFTMIFTEVSQLMPNPIEGNYPDLLSRVDPFNGVELKSRWMGSCAATVGVSGVTRKGCNNILFFSWGMRGNTPQIVSVYFANNLEEDDWTLYEGKNERTGNRPSGALNKKGAEKLKNGWLMYDPWFDIPS